jgi:transposase
VKLQKVKYMSKKNRKTKFTIELGLSHIKIKSIKIDEFGNYHIYVSCTATKTVCHKCGKTITNVHGHCEETVIEHLPILEKRVFIHVKWPRFKCPDCDNNPTTSFRPPWLSGNGQQTIPYEDYCLKWLINSTIKDVADKLKSTEEIIEAILRRRVNTDINWERISPTKIGIDEIALRKGHTQYLTIISDISIPHNVKILAVIKGRKNDDIFPFLNSIPRKKLLSLKSITIDMSASYFPALKKIIKDDNIFNHIVTIDRFHVAKLLGDKVDKERKKVVKQLKIEFENNEEKLNNIKQTMWPFRHHGKDLSIEEQRRLNHLLEMSSSLKECYDFRESLFNIFELDISKKQAEEKINEWIESAKGYVTKGHNPFTSFIKTYESYRPNILNYFTHRCSSGPVEGLNNKIKVIKRRGYGFRNIMNFARRIFLDINLKPIFMPTS